MAGPLMASTDGLSLLQHQILCMGKVIWANWARVESQYALKVPET